MENKTVIHKNGTRVWISNPVEYGEKIYSGKIISHTVLGNTLNLLGDDNKNFLSDFVQKEADQTQLALDNDNFDREAFIRTMCSIIEEPVIEYFVDFGSRKEWILDYQIVGFLSVVK